MGQSVAKIPYCSKCGEEARPEALFCFACGGKVIDPALLNEDGVSKSWFKEDLAADEPIPLPTDEPVADEKSSNKEVSSDKNSKDDTKSEESDKNSRKSDAKEERLTSAKELRLRPKPVQTKKVEVIWSENADSPNYLFLVFGGLAVVVSLFLFVMSVYLS